MFFSYGCPSSVLYWYGGISQNASGSNFATFCFRAEIGWLRTREKNCEPGQGFVKICRAKKARVGAGGEHKRAQDDAYSTGVTV